MTRRVGDSPRFHRFASLPSIRDDSPLPSIAQVDSRSMASLPSIRLASVDSSAGFHRAFHRFASLPSIRLASVDSPRFRRFASLPSIRLASVDSPRFRRFASLPSIRLVEDSMYSSSRVVRRFTFAGSPSFPIQKSPCPTLRVIDRTAPAESIPSGRCLRIACCSATHATAQHACAATVAPSSDAARSATIGADTNRRNTRMTISLTPGPRRFGSIRAPCRVPSGGRRARLVVAEVPPAESTPSTRVRATRARAFRTDRPREDPYPRISARTPPSDPRGTPRSVPRTCPTPGRQACSPRGRPRRKIAPERDDAENQNDLVPRTAVARHGAKRVVHAAEPDDAGRVEG